MKRIAVFVPVAAWALMVPLAAYAGTVYQGADYSYTTDSNRKAGICDKEADGRTAYVRYVNGNGDIKRINDLDGSSGYCWVNEYREYSGIAKHKTCEDINNWPDNCSGWSEHF